MFFLIRAIFYKPPKVGDIYILDNEDRKNPFSDKVVKCEVLDVKGGWVRYSWMGSTLWTNETSKVSSFHGSWVKDCNR